MSERPGQRVRKCSYVSLGCSHMGQWSVEAMEAAASMLPVRKDWDRMVVTLLKRSCLGLRYSGGKWAVADRTRGEVSFSWRRMVVLTST